MQAVRVEPLAPSAACCKVRRPPWEPHSASGSTCQASLPGSAPAGLVLHTCVPVRKHAFPTAGGQGEAADTARGSVRESQLVLGGAGQHEGGPAHPCGPRNGHSQRGALHPFRSVLRPAPHPATEHAHCLTMGIIMHSRWELQTNTSCILPTKCWKSTSVTVLKLFSLRGARGKMVDDPHKLSRLTEARRAACPLCKGFWDEARMQECSRLSSH